MSWPRTISHNSTSKPFAQTSVLPSGEYAILSTPSQVPISSSVSRSSSSFVPASYIQIPISVPTARRAPSGEYATSVGFPLPRRAMIPSGRCHCGESSATLFGTKISIINVRVTIENSVVFNGDLLFFMSMSKPISVHQGFSEQRPL